MMIAGRIAGVNFNSILRAAFLWKCFSKLFCAYSFSLILGGWGKKIGPKAAYMIVKCL